jgi:predicted RecB family nuclease
MRKSGNKFQFSASDLIGFLNCHPLTALDRAVAEGALSKPKVWDPLLDVLRERGAILEQGYVDHLKRAGMEAIKIDGIEVTDTAVAETLAAMKRGIAVIVQAALSGGEWLGRADILRRVEKPGTLGAWSYEPVDTKLARETRAGSVLQLCLYADLLTAMQGCEPDNMYVVVPWSEFEPQVYRYADYAAYFRQVKRGMLDSFTATTPIEVYPNPIEHCDICRWRVACDKRRRDDDHPCLVAGISKIQINELKQRGVTTTKALAALPLPLPWKPERGSKDSYTRVREQARIQVEARETGQKKFELLPVEPGFGLARLPEPSLGDVFLDFEGDPFIGEGGLEYLIGYLFPDDAGKIDYRGRWAFTRADEKRAFEEFVDFVMARWAKFPGLHVYHYAPYEPAALKRLMGRYATREDEIDRMLRAGVFVDLYQVVRQGLRASVENYSIKTMEPFYGFVRDTRLSDANVALANLQAGLEFDDLSSIADETKATVLGYNKDDCASTIHLRNWLEGLREGLIAEGADVARPVPGDGSPNEKVTDWIIKINVLIERLTVGIPVDPAGRDPEQHARWLLANMLDWHRREEKVVWWEKFRLSDLSEEDLLDERSGLSGLTFVGNVGGTSKAPIHRYRFVPQETEFRGGETLLNVGGDKLGSVGAISFEHLTVDIKKRQDTLDIHPRAVFAHKHIDTQEIADAIVRISEHIVDHGMHGEGPYRAARDLLLRQGPRVGGQILREQHETAVEAAVRLCGHLNGGILPIQGPPGAGKTFTGAQMICELVRQGKTVGITANSHKVIRNLIDETIKLADKFNLNLQCCHKADELGPAQHRLTFAKRSEDLIIALGQGVMVGGGTAWLWSRPDAFETIDVLFVDEAAQMALARVLAVSQAAKTVVLIGDPQQLDQPVQGSHPDGTEVSVLDHILAGEHTVPPDKGLFLEETWRLHPAICAFTSELFYDGKLRSRDGLEMQIVKSTSLIKGSGLRFLPVAHNGNQNCSPEEADAVARIVNDIIKSNTTWMDREARVRPVTLDDILIMAPYNAQVFEIQQRLAGARVGTVDKFQGQQAPIAVYSMATSSQADAPRGMEFLYSLNRLNVATSRAKCISILVASLEIFEAKCRTPRQIQLANAFCRYLEMAEKIWPITSQ